jgi:AcrR family transcriptional regulator
MRTPWGELETLRERRLPAGSPREALRKEQRELLFAAMVACCEQEGYEATSVADLLEASGLSRGTFYANFDDKLACFSAAENEIVRMAVGLVRQRLDGEVGGGSAEARARAALETFVELVVAQPAAARLCLVESFGPGEVGAAPIRAAAETLTELGRRSLEEMPGGTGVPIELARAIIGGFYKVVYDRVESGRGAELPDLLPGLWDWAMSYRPLAGPLVGSARRSQRDGIGAMPPFAAFDPEQRIIRGFAAIVAEKGLPATTIADVCAAASISQTTFYHHFGDRADLLRGALDSSGAQLEAAALPPARRAPDWPSSVRAWLDACCGFFAAEPDLARLRMVAVYSGGPAAIAARDESGLAALRGLLASALAERPELHPVVLEASIGAIFGVLYERIRAGDGERLPEAAPLLTYLVLAPLLGAEQAHAVATSRAPGPRRAAAGRGRRRSPAHSA